jgi:HEAT repeat protein
MALHLADMDEEMRQRMFTFVMGFLKDSNDEVRRAASKCLSSLAAQVMEGQQEIRPAISGVLELLRDSDWDVRQDAINCVSSLGAQGT